MSRSRRVYKFETGANLLLSWNLGSAGERAALNTHGELLRDARNGMGMSLTFQSKCAIVKDRLSTSPIAQLECRTIQAPSSTLWTKHNLQFACRRCLLSVFSFVYRRLQLDNASTSCLSTAQLISSQLVFVLSVVFFLQICNRRLYLLYIFRTQI